jgi:hypothetical protein
MTWQKIYSVGKKKSEKIVWHMLLQLMRAQVPKVLPSLINEVVKSWISFATGFLFREGGHTICGKEQNN